jgi:phenylpyruvate tautomerase PptA (4-oxalocrotonate tautomerase family)
MPFSRITSNFFLKEESSFIDEFHNKMMSVLKIPEHDRQIVLNQNTEGFYQPTNSSGKYMIFEIKMFSGRTFETKKKLYKELFALAHSVGVKGTNVNVILEDIEKENWGIRGGQPASDVDLGFDTDI